MAYGPWKGARWRTVWNNGYYRIDVQWDYRQDIANNKTMISLKRQRITKLGAYSFYNASCQVGFKDFAGKGSGFTASVNLSNATSVEVKPSASIHSECSHNADGTWPTVLCGWWRFNAGLNGQYHSPTQSWTAFNGLQDTIPTIPRATIPKLSASSVTMGNAVTITLNRATSVFTHDVSFKFGSTSGTIATGAGTSCTWTPPVSLARQIPKAESGTATITVQTKNGSTVIGTKTVNLTLLVPTSVVPLISAHTVAEATTGLAAKFGGFVQSKSAFKVTTTATGSQGSTITSYKTIIDNRSYMDNPCISAPIDTSGEVSVVTTVTDSRGRTASKTSKIQVLAYKPPEIKTSSVSRTSDEALTAKVDYGYSISSVNGKNDKSFITQYLNGSSWVTMSSNTSDYEKTGSFNTGAVFGVDSTTRVRFVAKDYFSEVSIEREVGPTFTLINFGTGGKSIALGMVSGNQPKTIQNALTQVPSLRTSGSGSGGYMKILQVKTKAQARNYNCVEFEFYVGGKAKPFTKGSVTVIGDSSTDPNVGYIRTSDPDVPIYVVKANKNTWDIYVNKVGSEQIGFMNVHVYRPDAVTASVQNQWVSALPSGYSKSAWEHLDACYPVNSVKITTDAVNPGTKIGGTWVQFAQGRTLIGQGTGNDGKGTKTFSANSTGGGYSHIHEYNILYSEYYGSMNTPHAEKYDANGNISWSPGVKQSSSGSSAHVGSSGAGTSAIDQYILTGQTRSVGETLMPYQVVYFWKRTA